MNQKQISLTIPENLFEASKEYYEELGYRNLQEFILDLIRKKVIIEKHPDELGNVKLKDIQIWLNGRELSGEEFDCSSSNHDTIHVHYTLDRTGKLFCYWFKVTAPVLLFPDYLFFVTAIGESTAGATGNFDLLIAFLLFSIT